MATLVATAVERRRDRRVSPLQTCWRPAAVLRPGLGVVLLNISRCGALVESAARLRPGSQTELQLSGVVRQAVRGRLERCQVAAIDPLRYRAVLVFEAPLELPGHSLGE